MPVVPFHEYHGGRLVSTREEEKAWRGGWCRWGMRGGHGSGGTGGIKLTFRIIIQMTIL